MRSRILVSILVALFIVNAAYAGSYVQPVKPVMRSSALAVDGVVSSGEYDYSFQIKKEIYFHYTIVRGVIQIGLEMKGTGWVSIGWGGTGSMTNYDVVTGGYDASTGTSYAFDCYSIGKVVPPPDAQQDVISHASSESGGWTTFEFTKALNTGDTNNDHEIIPGVQIPRLIFAYQSTSDDISVIHSKEGKYDLFTFYGPPAAPKGLVASSTETQVSLSWNASEGDGGFALSGYTVYRSEDDGLTYTQIATLSTTSYVDTSVVTGTIYKYKVTASNSQGESGDSNVVIALPLGQITEPQNVTTSSGSKEVNVTWSPPANSGGIPVLSYNVYKSTDPNTGFVLYGNSTTTSFTDNDVTNGYTYYYMVSALNKYNESALSTSVAANPVGESSEPENVTIVNGDNFAQLDWDAPVTDGGFPIEYYNIYRSNVSGSGYSLVGTNTSATGFLDNTAVNGETYFYVVTAVNSYGESQYSSEQRIMIANTPLAPTGLSVVAGDGVVDLTWATADGRGFAILNYTVYKFDADAGKFVVLAITNETSYSDTGLTNGEEYTYVVTATSEVGESPFSNVAKGIPATEPSEPLNLKARVVGEDIVLSWDKPLEDGGLPISGYSVYRSTDAAGPFQVIGNSVSRFFEDTSATYGTTYYYKVSASNSRGEGPMSSTVDATPLDTPSAPNHLAAWFDGKNITLTWEMPESNGNITGYNVYRTKVQGTPYIYIGSSSSVTYVDNDIRIGEHYYYVVTAVNEAGESEESNEALVSTLTLPPVPETIVLFASQEAVTLTWLPGPGDLMPADYYMVFKSDDNVTYENVGNTSELYYVDADIEFNVTYYYYLIAVNSVGQSEKSEVVFGTPQEATANVPATQNSDGEGAPQYTEEPNYTMIGATSGVFLSVGALAAILLILKKSYSG